MYYLEFKPYSNEKILKAIRARILPSVVLISCATEEGGAQASAGSGVYFIDETGAPSVETNAHVLLGVDGEYHGCVAHFPKPADGAWYDVSYPLGEPEVYDKSRSVVEGQSVDGVDYAVAPVYGPGTSKEGEERAFPPNKPDVYAEIKKLCRAYKSTPAIGDAIFMLGYPDVGGESLTLTEGVISGFSGEHGEWIKVSANTAHGNSGGIAIGARSGCSYGIPSVATFKEGGNLGYVLSAPFIRQFRLNQTGETTYTPPDIENVEFLPYSFVDFSLRYPGDWEVSTSTDSSGVIWTTFMAPFEGALDKMREYLLVGYKPNTTDEFSVGVVETVISTAKQLDPDAVIDSMAVGGREAIRVYFGDSSEEYVPAPLTHSTLFYYLPNKSFYNVGAHLENGLYSKEYVELFGKMFSSIRFK